ncbi:hypothetical protein BJ165DRAFT_725208 [Panaeolus papilionaceus]|nr:hypothetical protein BJ165DRAFT_725208 [Panaeolus papilionaceus]
MLPSDPTHRRVVSSPVHSTRSAHDHVLLKSEQPASSSSPASSKPKAASRLMHSVKRSFTQSTPRKRSAECSVRTYHVLSWTQLTMLIMQKNGMQSTYEETSPLPHFRQPDPVSSRPTIEQIAMGLHISRTPHLRPLGSPTYSLPPRHPNAFSSNPYDLHNHRSAPITLPPPPSRSSMKKPSATVVTSSSSSPALSPPFSHESGSSTTMTSVTPSSTNAPRSFSAIKSRMARFLPSSRSASTSSPTSTMVSAVDSPRSSTSIPLQKKAVRFTTDEKAS